MVRALRYAGGEPAVHRKALPSPARPVLPAVLRTLRHRDTALSKEIDEKWEPGCDCGTEETVPATVLNPFVGSGTTGVVAIEEGRAALLIEPKAEYREII